MKQNEQVRRACDDQAWRSGSNNPQPQLANGSKHLNIFISKQLSKYKIRYFLKRSSQMTIWRNLWLRHQGKKERKEKQSYINWNICSPSREHNMLVSREGIAGNVYESLKTIWFMHRYFRENFPVQLDVLFHQSVHEITIVYL